MNMIRDEIGIASWSLRALSAAAGKSIPDAMSEFYCYSTTTTTTANPCYIYPEIGFGSTANTACNNAISGSFIAVAGNASLFQNATIISRRCPLGSASNVGWYSNGVIARQWNGVGFIQQSPCQQ
jgi:hypothetical protein